MNLELLMLTLRVERLERQARRWRFLTIVVVFVGLCGAAAVTAQQTAVTVTGSRFVLQGSDTRTRAVLEMRGIQPTLSFFDGRGRERLQVAVLDTGMPSIKWLDQDGKLHQVLSGPGLRPLTTP